MKLKKLFSLAAVMIAVAMPGLSQELGAPLAVRHYIEAGPTPFFLHDQAVVYRMVDVQQKSTPGGNETILTFQVKVSAHPAYCFVLWDAQHTGEGAGANWTTLAAEPAACVSHWTRRAPPANDSTTSKIARHYASVGAMAFDNVTFKQGSIQTSPSAALTQITAMANGETYQVIEQSQG